jgi:type II secretory pathway predicted ATPase ExeA
MSPSALLKDIARGLGALAQGHRHQVVSNILHALSQRREPPVLVVDEGHHLGGRLDTLETLREIGDRGRIGMIVAGHDDLESIFRDRATGPYEQWRSRFDRRERLPGLSEDEVRMIARGELGEVSSQVLAVLARASAVTHRGFKYLSARALFKALRQGLLKRSKKVQ